MCVGRTAFGASVVGLPVSAGGMTALSSLVGPAVPVPWVFGVSWVPEESCIMACSMAVVTFLACCRAVALRVFLSTFQALGIVCSDSVLVY